MFNARFEFVEFELHGLFLSRKRVRIESDLVGLAEDPKAQKLLQSSFQLIENNSESSGNRVINLKKHIVKEYLISLPGYGTVVLRTRKEQFEKAVGTLKRYVERFQKRLKEQLQTAIDSNRETLTQALLPGVVASRQSAGLALLAITQGEKKSSACFARSWEEHSAKQKT